MHMHDTKWRCLDMQHTISYLHPTLLYCTVPSAALSALDSDVGAVIVIPKFCVV